ncbi:MAG: aspartate aminotransferase family protein [Thermosynechococcaceae cyanobacterium MS004]|nr:aspartate aminotransferase family protein [Thermosynechococcaceae cyanobacterium MS004]
MFSHKSSPWDAYFLTNTQEGIEAYQAAIAAAVQTLTDWVNPQQKSYSGLAPNVLAADITAMPCCPDKGTDLTVVLNQIGQSIVQNSVSVTHPTCIAHLHCPPLIAALATEVLITATNQSMDSWDQSPAGTIVEQYVVDWLCQLYGYSPQSDGTFTSGGTQSNLMGMLMARDAYAYKKLNWSIQQQGLPPEASRFRILCSDVAHFTICQSAALLGLGHQAVVPIQTDASYTLRGSAVDQAIAALQQQELLPIALVATVGTTDFGSIDNLLELANCARQHELWLHTDAAFGGALALSDHHRNKLIGIEYSDSITVDFHKLFYQPISCGAFLLKNKTHFDLFKLHADYLNPEDNADLGIPDLVTKSIQTTRRFDALKLFVSLQTLGRETLAKILDATIDLASNTAQLIEDDPELELAAYPTINTVVFRYCPQPHSTKHNCLERSNQINRQVRLKLLQQGDAVIAQTKIGAYTHLKFTLLNPRTTLSDIQSLLTQIKNIGSALDV